MTNMLGDEYRLYVSNGEESPTFAVLKGQTGISIDDSTNLIDTSSKSTGRIGTQRPGRRSLTIQVTGKIEVPDATGVEYVYDLAIADPSVPEDFQIRKTPFGTSDKVLEGSFYVGGVSRDMPDQDNATYQFTLTPAAAPTTDVMDL